MGRKRQRLATGRKNPAFIQEWLDRGMDQPGKTGRGLAIALGLDPSGVSQMRRGEREIKVGELPLIAEYTGMPLPPEIGGWVETARPATELGSREEASLIRVTAVIAPDVWRGSPVTTMERVPAWPHNRLRGARQYACKFEAQPGRYAVCVPYNDMRARPISDDFLHVRRTTRGQHEDTLRVVRILGNQVRLQLESAPLEEKNAWISLPSSDGDESVEIMGLVVAFYMGVDF